jgi:N6-adenosine-specific RNA methylase IME4
MAASEVIVSPVYRTIVADPPWQYKTPGQIGKTLEHRPNRDKGLSVHGAGSVARYGAMSLQSLMNLPIRALSDSSSHLYLWTTNAFVCEAHDVARSWGFRPITLLTWTKIKENGRPSMKMGRYFRGATEHCLFAVRGSMRLRGPAASTAILSPRTAHSVKPDDFYKLVEQQSYGPYLELFARRPRVGWHVWGDEVESDIELGEREWSRAT